MKENVFSSIGLYDKHHFLPLTLKRRIVVIYLRCVFLKDRNRNFKSCL